MKADISTLHKPDILILRRQRLSSSLCPGQERCTMHQPGFQIGASGPLKRAVYNSR
jgi:hypothetical protein